MGKMLIIKGASYTAPSEGGGGGRPSSSAIRAAVTAYLTASGADAATWEAPLKTLVSGLMSAGIWDRLIGFYPMLGSSAVSMGVNLRDPEVSPMTQGGSGSNVNIFPDEGIQYAAGNAYMQIEQTWTEHNDYHTMAYYKDYGFVGFSNLFVPLTQGLGNSNGSVALIMGDGNIVYRSMMNAGITAAAQGEGVGRYMCASYGIGGNGINHNGTALATSSLGSGGFNNTTEAPPILMFCYKEGSSARMTQGVRMRCCSFGQSLSSAQQQTLLQLCEAFKPDE